MLQSVTQKGALPIRPPVPIKKKNLKTAVPSTQSLQALPSVSYERKLLCCEIVGFCVER